MKKKNPSRTKKEEELLTGIDTVIKMYQKEIKGYRDEFGRNPSLTDVIRNFSEKIVRAEIELSVLLTIKNRCCLEPLKDVLLSLEKYYLRLILEDPYRSNCTNLMVNAVSEWTIYTYARYILGDMSMSSVTTRIKELDKEDHEKK